MMEVVLNRLRDFSCRSSQFEGKAGAGAEATGGLWRDVPPRDKCRTAGHMDIESALAWLRTELMEMRCQDQALIRQLMELHSGIQELKQELREEEEEEEEEEAASGEREGSEWDSDSDHSSSQYSSSGEVSYLATPMRKYKRSRKRGVRRSSVP
ncbi:unnamed protein product [Knipowitschia caucasica]|uniref:Uncharacterized protein n=1 Tax=Knipowitschia caucasica TaxID=637954 RepID=A0AAV2K4M9_KNICA